MLRTTISQLLFLCACMGATFALIESSSLLHTVFQLLVKLPLHELGHAVVSNLGGRPAVPTPAGFTSYLTKARVPALALGLVVGWIWLARHARRRNLVVLSNTCSLCAILQLILSFLLPPAAFEMLCIWGGFAGELIFGALLAMSFVVPMPESFNWQKNRYLFSTLGAISLVSSTRSWILAALDRSKLPWGGIWRGLLVGDGDLDRLRDEFAWSEDTMLTSYLILSSICWTATLGVFLWAFMSAFVRGAEESSGARGSREAGREQRARG